MWNMIKQVGGCVENDGDVKEEGTGAATKNMSAGKLGGQEDRDVGFCFCLEKLYKFSYFLLGHT